ncbi:MAG: hypothetical protein FJZ96_06430 [Chloroflexi bacterium]|nr:hypothetical protein [Chloroflexota bacterium]
MHHRLGAVGVEFEHVEQAVLPVEGGVADAVAALVAPAEVLQVPFGRADGALHIPAHPEDF